MRNVHFEFEKILCNDSEFKCDLAVYSCKHMYKKKSKAKLNRLFCTDMAFIMSHQQLEYGFDCVMQMNGNTAFILRDPVWNMAFIMSHQLLEYGFNIERCR